MEALQVLENFNSTLGVMEEKLKALQPNFDVLEDSLTRVGNKANIASAKFLAFVGVAKFMMGSAKASIAFDDAVSKLGTTAGVSGKELDSLKQKALDLGSSTSFTAMEIIQAQTVMAKEGLGSSKIIGSMSDFINVAAVSNEKLSVAAKAGAAALKAFKGQALTSAQAANIFANASLSSGISMKSMGEIISTSGKSVSKAGGDLALLTSISKTLADANIKTGDSAKSIKTMFSALSSPSKATANALKELNIDTKNLDFMGVMAKLDSSLKGMASSDKSKYIEKIFGKDAVESVGAMFDSGIGNINKYAQSLRKSTVSAAEIAKIKLNNLGGSLKKLNASTSTLSIVFGSIFQPALKLVADVLTFVVRCILAFLNTGIGKFILSIASAIAVGVAAFFAYQAACAGVVIITGVLQATLAALSWPVILIIGAIALLYLAWKNNFGGMADYVSAFFNKVSLVFKGVKSVFATMKNGVGVIKGELGENIEANGLVGLVTIVAKVVFRIKQFFTGLFSAMAAGFKKIGGIFKPVISSISGAFTPLFQIIGYVTRALAGAGASTNASSWKTFGEIVGVVVGSAFEILAWGIRAALTPFKWMMDIIGFLLNLFILLGQAIGTFAGFIVTKFMALQESFKGIGASIVSVFSWVINCAKFIFMNFTPLGIFIKAFLKIKDFLSGMSLAEAGRKIIESLVSGIKSIATAPFKAVKKVFSKVRNLLPFSNAKEGPLSNLTGSGEKVMTTLGSGMKKGGPELSKTAEKTIGNAGITQPFSLKSKINKSIIDFFKIPVPGIAAAAGAAGLMAGVGVTHPVDFGKTDQDQFKNSIKSSQENQNTSKRLVIQNLTLNLPNISDSKAFISELENIVNSYEREI